MRTRWATVLMALSVGPLTLWGKMDALPDPMPPFQASAGKRVAAEFKDASLHTTEGTIPLYDLTYGNKRVGIEASTEYSKRRDEAVSVTVDDHEVLTITFWGAYEGYGFGYPFKTKEGTVPEVTGDGISQTIRYAKKYQLPDGTTETFTYTLKPLGEGRAELSWECSGPQGVSPRLTFQGDYRDAGIEADGVAADFPDPSLLNPQLYKPTPVGQGSASKIVYAPDNPLKSFTVEVPEAMDYSSSESNTGGGKQFEYMIAANRKSSIIIDLGLSSVASASAPPPLAGINFWQNDAVHVPAPSSRNLVPNPSFEQGLRYWRWWWGGASYQAVKTPVYSVVEGGLFGRNALLITPYPAAQVMQSLPFAIENGKTYTVSLYAKTETPGCSITFGAMSAAQGSQLTWEKAQAVQQNVGVGNWERKSFTFTSDTRGICLQLAATAPVLIDGIQMEEGSQPTEFVAPSVEGLLVCSDPTNVVEAGQPIGAKLILSGKPNANGGLAISVRDFYRRNVLTLKKKYALNKKGTASVDLPLDSVIGKGIYIIQVEFQPQDSAPRTDYYRLAVLKSLNNTHPTRTLFGNSRIEFTTENDAEGKLYMRYGWGYGTDYGGTKDRAEFLDKYRIAYGPALVTYIFAGFGHITDPDLIKKFRQVCLYQDSISDEDTKFIEDTVYDVVKANLWSRSWALTTEAETESKLIKARRFDEYAKIQLAFWRGVKRANPDAVVYPDGGTSGWSDSRGLVEMTGYLAATERKVKWDAIAVHPYGDLDGVHGSNDLDAEMSKLVPLMKRYGYGSETPITIDETFNLTPTKIPEWGDVNGWNDDYDQGLPSYDSGWKEFIQASWVARTYIMFMKYWPQLQSVNIWCPGFSILDQYLTPASYCLVPNTLGNLFPNPKFKADIRPAAGIRGYAFEDAKGNCTVAIWCAMDRVDEGFEKGPEIGVKLDDIHPEIFDLMDNKCSLPKAANGVTTLQLSPAPLFLRVGQAQADRLVKALSGAEVSGVGSSLRLSIKPALGGKVEAKLENLTGNPLTGKLALRNSSLPFDIPPLGSMVKDLPFMINSHPGTIEPWKQTIGVAFANGKKDQVKWDMSSLFVPHTAQPLPSDPDNKAWDSIPSIPVTNWIVKDTVNPPPHGFPGDLDAKFQLAWDKDNLYLRVSCQDDKFVPLPQDKWTKETLYRNDGAVEVYLDTIASGRSNMTDGYDQYDYRYDFAPSDGSAVSGPGTVYRLQEVFSQLAGGIAMPTKEQAAKGVKCEYRRNGNSYSYVMILPQLYIEPLHLEKGWRAGFGLHIHDKDEGEKSDPTSPEKGVTISTKQGVPCNYRPAIWPIMVLGE